MKFVQIVKSAPGHYVLLDDNGRLWAGERQGQRGSDRDNERMEVRIIPLVYL